jgi:hypothetical protein
MPEEDLHLFDLTRLQAHEGRNKSGHDDYTNLSEFAYIRLALATNPSCRRQTAPRA